MVDVSWLCFFYDHSQFMKCAIQHIASNHFCVQFRHLPSKIFYSNMQFYGQEFFHFHFFFLLRFFFCGRLYFYLLFHMENSMIFFSTDFFIYSWKSIYNRVKTQHCLNERRERKKKKYKILSFLLKWRHAFTSSSFLI